MFVATQVNVAIKRETDDILSETEQASTAIVTGQMWDCNQQPKVI
jgi:hypothetical protein